MANITPSEYFFISRGKCPDCRSDLETREYSTTSKHGRRTSITVEYCNECESAKDMKVFTENGPVE